MKIHMTGNKYCIGRKLSPEHKEKLRAGNIENKYWLGKKLSEKHKEKIRDAHIGKNHSEQSKAKMSAAKKKKQVHCVELNKIFAGVNIAAKKLSLSASHISKCCQGKRKTCGRLPF